MSKDIFLFFVRSDFHYLICKSIIRQYQLDNKCCFFKPERDVSLEKDVTPLPQILNDLLSVPLYLRLILYFRKKKLIDSYLKNKKVTIYLPFVFRYTRHSLCNIEWYEEGMSSYITNYKPGKDNYLFTIKGYLIYYMSRFIFKNDARRAFVFRLYNASGLPKENTNIYTLSSQSYSSITSPLIYKKIVNLDTARRTCYDIPKGSYVMVLDRFTEGGRPYLIENYIECLRKEIEYIENQRVGIVWFKFHPADSDDPSSNNVFYEFIKDYNIEFKLFQGKLEYWAQQDTETHFIGTNSTILFYAPLFGKSNVSVSFSKYLASIDKEYETFMELYGGVNKFISVFSKNVICL